MYIILDSRWFEYGINMGNKRQMSETNTYKEHLQCNEKKQKGRNIFISTPNFWTMQKFENPRQNFDPHQSLKFFDPNLTHSTHAI